jgi:hypothetical protein
MTQEIWKPVVGYEGLYEVSNLGNVRSINYNHTWIKRNLSLMKTLWYNYVSVYKLWETKRKRVHILVCEAFLWKSIWLMNQVNHINWIKDDNRVENLEWVDASYNAKHAYTLWLNRITDKHISRVSPSWKWKFWKLHKQSKRIAQFDTNWDYLRTWDSTMDIERELWIWHANVSFCCKNHSRKTWWFYWKYA